MKHILIMVDVQNGFVKSDYAEESFKKDMELMEKDLFDEVIATKYWNVEGSNIWKLMDWHDLCTEQEQAIRPEVADKVDHIIMKDTYSSVTPEMIALLEELNGGELPEHVFIYGFDTECCVLTTATDLFELGVRPLVLTDYCGSHDGPRYHDAGIISMEHLIGPDFLIEGAVESREDLDRIAETAMHVVREK